MEDRDDVKRVAEALGCSLGQAKRVLERVAQKHGLSLVFQDFEWGAQHFFRWGQMMPAGAIDLLQPCDAILLGAVGHPEIPDHTTLNIVLGQSGDPVSAWFMDQFGAWLDGRTYTLPFTAAATQPSITHTLTLTPR